MNKESRLKEAVTLGLLLSLSAVGGSYMTANLFTGHLVEFAGDLLIVLGFTVTFTLTIQYVLKTRLQTQGE